MTTKDKVTTAWSNLGRRKVRTALTSVGVVVGILTLVTLVSLATGVRLQVKQQFEKIGLDRVTVRPHTDGDGGGFNPFSFGERIKIITPADVERWRRWPGVQEVTPQVDMPIGLQARLLWKNSSTPIRISDGDPMRRGPFSEAPKAIAGDLNVLNKSGAVVLSQGVLKKWKVAKPRELLGQSVTVQLLAPRGEKQSYQFKVIGVADGKSRFVIIPTASRIAMKNWWFNEKDSLKTEGYDSVTLRAGDVSGARAIVTKLRKEKLNVQSIDAILEVADRIFSVVTVMLSLVGGVALLVACIGIMNTMIMSIYERTREIGTLKAMGASRGDIRQMFMIEAGLIGFLGGAVGLILSWILGRGLNYAALWYAQKRDLPLPENLFVVTPLLALEAVAFATFIGMAAGLYPANHAARLDPLAALRHE
jgi:putative ABC transport system permease protein